MAENNTKELDFDRKHKEDLQRLRGLRLLDDDFMQKVFEDKACTEFLLQINMKICVNSMLFLLQKMIK